MVVDYVGIAAALKEAMNDFTNRYKSNFGSADIKDMAYPKFLEKLSICQHMFHGFEYSTFISGTDFDRAKQITNAVNFIIAVEREGAKKIFIKGALLLKQALSLCGSMVEREKRLEAAFLKLCVRWCKDYFYRRKWETFFTERN